MESNLKPRTAAEIFHEAFPMYLAMGMTYREFWELDSRLVKDYRKAREIKNEEINQTAWLNGLYFLQALNVGVPVVVKGFAKHGMETPDYPQKPFDFGQTEKKEKEEKQMELQKAKMREMVEQFNRTFKRKQTEKDKHTGGQPE